MDRYPFAATAALSSTPAMRDTLSRKVLADRTMGPLAFREMWRQFDNRRYRAHYANG
jgi:hypothetical protein